MHRALLIPEVIATILQTAGSSPGFLHTCLLINKLFSYQASQILWERCGTTHSSPTPTPEVKDLAHIILKSPQRGQIYANFIHELWFDSEWKEKGFEFSDDAIWHKELASLKFPQLEDLGVHPSPRATTLNAGEVIIHYSQSNMKWLSIQQGSRLSDSILDTLSSSCPKLRSLILENTVENMVTQDGLAMFLQKMDFLRVVSIRDGFEDSWSYKTFHALISFRNLYLLSIPDIQDDWVQSIRDASPIYPPFPNLRHFSTGISDKNLECLAQYATNMVSLELHFKNIPPSHNLLASASNFSQLRSLTAFFCPNSSVSGHELILLGEKCPQLTELLIGEIEGEAPTGIGISDNIIEEMTRKMPSLINFSFVLTSSTNLSWQSVLSFGRHCRNLQRLKLSSNFSWEDVIRSAQGEIFAVLSYLHIFVDKDNRGVDIQYFGVKTTLEFATRFVAMAPKLEGFAIEGGNEIDSHLEFMIEQVAMNLR